MPKSSYFKILPVLILIGLTVFGCKKGEEPIANVIKIGTAGPMTGDQSAFGQDQQNGVKLAVEEWNLKGGVLGKKIELVVGDDQHGKKAAEFVINDLKAKSVAILHDKTTYGQGLADEFRKGVEGEVKVTYHGGCPPGAKGFSGSVTI